MCSYSMQDGDFDLKFNTSMYRYEYRLGADLLLIIIVITICSIFLSKDSRREIRDMCDVIPHYLRCKCKIERGLRVFRHEGDGSPFRLPLVQWRNAVKPTTSWFRHSAEMPWAISHWMKWERCAAVTNHRQFERAGHIFPLNLLQLDQWRVQLTSSDNWRLINADLSPSFNHFDHFRIKAHRTIAFTRSEIHRFWFRNDDLMQRWLRADKMLLDRTWGTQIPNETIQGKRNELLVAMQSDFHIERFATEFETACGAKINTIYVRQWKIADGLSKYEPDNRRKRNGISTHFLRSISGFVLFRV